LTIEYSTDSSSQLANQSFQHADGNDKQNTEVVIRKVQQYGPFTDWIQDAQWLYEVCIARIRISHLARKLSVIINIYIKDDKSGVDATKIAMAFAHNFVEVYDITTERPARVFRVQCEEQCIL
jgi:hypothetical protein